MNDKEIKRKLQEAFDTKEWKRYRSLEEAIRTVIKAQDEGYKGFEVLISECGRSSRLAIVYPRYDFEEGSDYEFV